MEPFQICHEISRVQMYEKLCIKHFLGNIFGCIGTYKFVKFQHLKQFIMSTFQICHEICWLPNVCKIFIKGFRDYTILILCHRAISKVA